MLLCTAAKLSAIALCVFEMRILQLDIPLLLVP